MKLKLLAGSSCLILGACLLLANGMKQSSATISSGSDACLVTGNYSISLPTSQSRKTRTPVEGQRLGLVKKLDALLCSSEPINSERFLSLLFQLSGIDPVAAAGYATGLSCGPLREEALLRVSQAWTSKDPAAAQAWAAGLSNESQRQSALENICLRLAEDDAGEAVAVAEKYKLDTNLGMVVENLAYQWAVQDFPAAAAWIKARPAGEKRDQMVARLAFVRAATLPAQAGRLVVEEIPDGPVQAEAVISVIYEWAKQDIAGASEWVRAFPEGPLRNRAESELAGITDNRSQELWQPGRANHTAGQEER